MSLARWPWKQAIQISVNALCLVVPLLWGVRKFIFPSAEFFIGHRAEASFINHPQSGGFNSATSFVFHSLVAPPVRLIKDDAYAQAKADAFCLTDRLTFQFSAPGSAGWLGGVAVVLWSALLLNGLWRLLTSDRQLRFRLVLGGVLLFEFLLHLLYGEETFVYSLNFLPLLLAVAALGVVGPGRYFVVTLTALLLCCVALNNWQQFQAAAHSATQFTPQRELMTAMMQQDLLAPGPGRWDMRSLAIPGAPEGGTAYHEPGGDFSPQTPSFECRVLVLRRQGVPVSSVRRCRSMRLSRNWVPRPMRPFRRSWTKTPYSSRHVVEARWMLLAGSG
ncbi:MAG: hypothetical protein MRJ92_06630 [Nitrospira sp.]|nr:hypothetical protein [Nitrospira sp.]